MTKLILTIAILILSVVEAHYPHYPAEPKEGFYEVPLNPQPPRYRAKPYAHLDFSKAQFSTHEYAYRGTKSMALTFGLKF